MTQKAVDMAAAPRRLDVLPDDPHDAAAGALTLYEAGGADWPRGWSSHLSIASSSEDQVWWESSGWSKSLNGRRATGVNVGPCPREVRARLDNVPDGLGELAATSTRAIFAPRRRRER